MEDWVLRALARWPNVPALFGWLGLDRRGRWLIRGETISRPQIIDTINRNYAADRDGRWYFQNGPQRGYVNLAYAPLVLWLEEDGRLRTHTGRRVQRASAAYLDEEGSLLLMTEQGPAGVSDADLERMLACIRCEDRAVSEDELAVALALPSGAKTALVLQLPEQALALQRLDAAAAPAQLGFVREPLPRADEAASSGGAPD